MTRLHLLSDLHLEFEPFDMPSVNADVLVLAGDIGVGLQGVEAAIEWAQDRPVAYVPGNHEYYRQTWPTHLERMRKASQGSSVHILDRDQLIVNGARILGCTLWTDFGLFGESRAIHSQLAVGRRMKDYKSIRRDSDGSHLRPDDTREENARSIRWIRSQLAQPFDGETVVVTHHAPSLKSLDLARHGADDPLNPAYASHLDYLFGTGINLWVHGHTHYCVDYVLNGTRVVSNARGYPDDVHRPATGFDPDLVVEV